MIASGAGFDVMAAFALGTRGRTPPPLGPGELVDGGIQAPGLKGVADLCQALGGFLIAGRGRFATGALPGFGGSGSVGVLLVCF